MKRRPQFVLVRSLACSGSFPQAPPLPTDEPKWHEVHTAHFYVFTDAGDKRGREVALRMEQMRTLFGQLLLRRQAEDAAADYGDRAEERQILRA